MRIVVTKNIKEKVGENPDSWLINRRKTWTSKWILILI